MPDFDPAPAHKFFSAHCFNSTWELIDQPERTPEENEQMIQRAQASLWHWSHRPDCTHQNRSIGYWQISRVYALCNEPKNARKYAQLCLDITPADDAFCLGYAHEAVPVLSCFWETRNMQRKICPKPASAPTKSLILKNKKGRQAYANKPTSPFYKIKSNELK